MKKIIATLVVSACAAFAFAEEEKYEPNPYSWYDPAMKPVPGDPMAAEWHTKDGAKIAEMTDEKAIAPFTASASAAEALLAQVKGAYATDAFVAAQIDAVTMRVSAPGANAADRKVWVAALLKTAEKSTDSYVKTFCLGQLIVCAPKSKRSAIMEIGKKSGDKAVLDYAKAIVREL